MEHSAKKVLQNRVTIKASQYHLIGCALVVATLILHGGRPAFRSLIFSSFVFAIILVQCEVCRQNTGFKMNFYNEENGLLYLRRMDCSV